MKLGWERQVAAFEGRLGHTFKQRALLIQALTHRSYAGENPGVAHQERLEFLGDAVLYLATAEQLFELHPTLREGDLSRRRLELIRAESLVEAAKMLDLGEVLRLGRGEERSGGREKKRVLEDSMEAVLGAVFVDGGYAAGYRLVERCWGKRLRAAEAGDVATLDWKAVLSRELRAAGREGAVFALVEAAGPDHEPTFSVEVAVGGEVQARASGPSKKAASQEAARLAVGRLRDALGGEAP